MSLSAKPLWSSIPWLVSVVLALAFVHQKTQLRWCPTPSVQGSTE
jgi:hypothetical protein